MQKTDIADAIMGFMLNYLFASSKNIGAVRRGGPFLCNPAISPDECDDKSA